MDTVYIRNAVLAMRDTSSVCCLSKLGFGPKKKKCQGKNNRIQSCCCWWFVLFFLFVCCCCYCALFEFGATFWACDALFSCSDISMERLRGKKRHKLNKIVWVSVTFHFNYFLFFSTLIMLSLLLLLLFFSGSLCVRCDRLLLILSCFLIDFFLFELVFFM